MDTRMDERRYQYLEDQFGRIAAANMRAREVVRELRGETIDEPEDPIDDTDPEDEPEEPGAGWVRDVLDLREVDRDSGDWTHLNEERPGGDAYKLVDSAVAWSKHQVLLDGRAGWISNRGPDFGINALTWQDIEFGPHGGDPTKSAHWGIRAYGLRDTLIERMWAHDMRREFRDGHAVYIDLAGSIMVRDCLFENLGGQALQLTNRQHRTPPLHRPTEGGEVNINRVVCLDTGQGDGRGSWPISIAGIGVPDAKFDITVSQLFIDNSWPQPNRKGARSHGGVLVETGFEKHVYGMVHIDHADIRTVDSDRGHLTVNGADSLFVTDSAFWARGGKNRITLDRVDFDFARVAPIGSATFRRNRGNCEVWSRGKKVGMCTEDMVLENGVRVR